jgi:FAD/FMN-containing dehydrogenase
MATGHDGAAGLRAQMAGEVLGADDAGYEEARRVHNGLIDRRPALVARCRGTADVQAAVRFAREQKLEIAVGGSGHNVAGSAVCDGGLMIDLSGMRGVHVDPSRRRARAQGGATWGDYNRETQLHGLASTGGVVSTTGIAGLTLGGGLGWLMGVQGLAADRLRGVEMVTASGDVVRANHRENPELCLRLQPGSGIRRWALRAAGRGTRRGGARGEGR